MSIGNKGFTLVEVLACFFIIGIICAVVVSIAGSTLSVDKEKAYKLMKDNIVSISYDYINECDNNFIDCSYSWDSGKASFNAGDLKIGGYFDNLNSPIDNKDLSECLIINATKNSGVVNVSLLDNCY